MRICSFGCHGNPLHPNPAIAEGAHADLVATCKLASRLDVHHISLLAGTPAGGPEDKTPNWIINSAFVMWKDAYRWQWDEKNHPLLEEGRRNRRRLRGQAVHRAPHRGLRLQHPDLPAPSPGSRAHHRHEPGPLPPVVAGHRSHCLCRDHRRGHLHLPREGRRSGPAVGRTRRLGFQRLLR